MAIILINFINYLRYLSHSPFQNHRNAFTIRTFMRKNGFTLKTGLKESLDIEHLSGYLAVKPSL